MFVRRFVSDGYWVRSRAMHMLLIDLPLWLAFIIALAVCWGMTIFGLPGNWLIVALTGLVLWAVPADSRLAIAPAVWGVLVALAVAGEIAELATGSAAAGVPGGTRRGALGAIGGAFLAPRLARWWACRCPLSVRHLRPFYSARWCADRRHGDGDARRAEPAGELADRAQLRFGDGC